MGFATSFASGPTCDCRCKLIWIDTLLSPSEQATDDVVGSGLERRHARDNSLYSLYSAGDSRLEIDWLDSSRMKMFGYQIAMLIELDH